MVLLAHLWAQSKLVQEFGRFEEQLVGKTTTVQNWSEPVDILSSWYFPSDAHVQWNLIGEEKADNKFHCKRDAQSGTWNINPGN